VTKNTEDAIKAVTSDVLQSCAGAEVLKVSHYEWAMDGWCSIQALVLLAGGGVVELTLRRPVNPDPVKPR
jgi:hypothetical protein